MRLFSSFQSHPISVANLPGRKIQPQVLQPVHVCRTSYIRSQKLQRIGQVFSNIGEVLSKAANENRGVLGTNIGDHQQSAITSFEEGYSQIQDRSSPKPHGIGARLDCSRLLQLKGGLQPSSTHPLRDPSLVCGVCRFTLGGLVFSLLCKQMHMCHMSDAMHSMCIEIHVQLDIEDPTLIKTKQVFSEWRIEAGRMYGDSPNPMSANICIFHL